MATRAERAKLIFFKVLTRNGNSPIAWNHYAWTLPTARKFGKWHHVDKKHTLKMCRHGLHVTTDPAFYIYGSLGGGMDRPGRRVFLCEARGEEAAQNFTTFGDITKRAFRSVRLLREVKKPRRKRQDRENSSLIVRGNYRAILEEARARFIKTGRV